MSDQDGAGPAERGRFQRTDELTERALVVDARAIARGDILPLAAGRTTFPRYIDRAAGAHLWDVDGNRYVDFLLGYGPVILGHADPGIAAAANAELERGVCFAPLWSPRQVELAELLVDTIPGAERVLLLKTGSDATTAAVRLARIHTGRSVVVRSGYNGWHDWSVEQRAGVPDGVRRETIEFESSDLESLRSILADRGSEVACIVMMPCEDDVTSAEHLQLVRDLADSVGALLVFDEMRSGFRLSSGGAQQFFAVRADLATFSKAMANGYTISAVTGSAEVFDGLGSTKVSSSFHVNPGDMAAAIGTITRLRDTDALERIWGMGRMFLDGLEQIVGELGIPAEVVGYPPMPFMRFLPSDSAADLSARFHRGVVERGVLLHPDHQWFISAAHTPFDIEEALSVCRASLARL